ncbi:MAG: hypothetical protein ACI8TX_002228 [Hyphomicrobiaceae bacterium]|jgi:hypothetical protein
MNRSHRSSAALLVIFSIALCAGSAQAEYIVDLYGGYADTKDAQTSGMGGIRIGGYVERVPVVDVGIAVQISGFAPVRTPLFDIAIIPISPMLMVRLPLLVDDEFTRGRIQPYIGIGPTFMYQQLSFELGNDEDDKNEMEVGVEFDLGVNFHLRKWLSLFAEYRFTSASNAFGSGDIETNQILGGVGFHF